MADRVFRIRIEGREEFATFDEIINRTANDAQGLQQRLDELRQAQRQTLPGTPEYVAFANAITETRREVTRLNASFVDIDEIINRSSTTVFDYQQRLRDLRNARRFLDPVSDEFQRLGEVIAEAQSELRELNRVPTLDGAEESLRDLSEITAETITSFEQLVETRDEVQRIFETSTFGTPQYREAASELQRLNSQIANLEEAVTGLTTQERIEGALILPLQGVVSSLNAASAAADLFGGSLLGISSGEIQRLTQILTVLLGIFEAANAFAVAFGRQNTFLTGVFNRLGIGIGRTTVQTNINTAATEANTVAKQRNAQASQQQAAGNAQAGRSAQGFSRILQRGGRVVLIIGAAIAAIVLIIRAFSSSWQSAGEAINAFLRNTGILDFIERIRRGFNQLIDTLRDFGNAIAPGIITDAATSRSIRNINRINRVLTALGATQEIIQSQLDLDLARLERRGVRGIALQREQLAQLTNQRRVLSRIALDLQQQARNVTGLSQRDQVRLRQAQRILNLSIQQGTNLESRRRVLEQITRLQFADAEAAGIVASAYNNALQTIIEQARAQTELNNAIRDYRRELNELTNEGAIIQIQRNIAQLNQDLNNLTNLENQLTLAEQVARNQEDILRRNLQTQIQSIRLGTAEIGIQNQQIANLNARFENDLRALRRETSARRRELINDELALQLDAIRTAAQREAASVEFNFNLRERTIQEQIAQNARQSRARIQQARAEERVQMQALRRITTVAQRAAQILSTQNAVTQLTTQLEAIDTQIANTQGSISATVIAERERTIQALSDANNRLLALQNGASIAELNLQRQTNDQVLAIQRERQLQQIALERELSDFVREQVEERTEIEVDSLGQIADGENLTFARRLRQIEQFNDDVREQENARFNRLVIDERQLSAQVATTQDELAQARLNAINASDDASRAFFRIQVQNLEQELATTQSTLTEVTRLREQSASTLIQLAQSEAQERERLNARGVSQARQQFELQIFAIREQTRLQAEQLQAQFNQDTQNVDRRSQAFIEAETNLQLRLAQLRADARQREEQAEAARIEQIIARTEQVVQSLSETQMLVSDFFLSVFEARFNAEQENIEARLMLLDEQATALEQRLALIDEQLNERQGRLNDLDAALADATGARQAEIIGQIERERAASQRLRAERARLRQEERDLANERDRQAQRQLQVQEQVAQAQQRAAAIASIAAVAQSGVAAARAFTPGTEGLTVAGIFARIAAGTALVVSLAQSIGQIRGSFHTGGFTGSSDDMPYDQNARARIAGLVHENEYVVDAPTLATPHGRALVDQIDLIRTGRMRGFQDGGFTSNVAPTSPNMAGVTAADLASSLISGIAALPAPRVGVDEISDVMNDANVAVDEASF